MGISDIRGMGTLLGTFNEPAPVAAGAAAGGVAGSMLGLAARWTGLPPALRIVAAVAGGLAGAVAGALFANRAASHRPSPAAAGADELRVVTVNIHMGVAKGRELGDAHESIDTLNDIAAWVRELDADVVFVQEVDDDVPGSTPEGVPRQLSVLGSLMGADEYEYAARGEPSTQNRYGVATYVRNGIDIDDVEVTVLPHSPGYEARKALRTHVVLPDGTGVTLVNTHLDHSGVDRPAQLDALSELMGGIDGSVILGGDLNTTADVADASLKETGHTNVLSSPWTLSQPAGIRDAVAAPTYLIRRIDHVYTSPGVDVSRTWTEEIPMRDLWFGIAVSDHRPVVADVTIGGPEAG